MSKYSALIKRASNATAAMALTLASLTPAVMLGSSAKAGQVTSRSIDMSNSASGGTSNYTVAFNAPTSAQYAMVEFCENSPLIGTACTASNISFSGASYTSGASSATFNANKMKIDFGVGGISGAESVLISGVTNPTDVDSGTGGNQIGTFYARIVTYTSNETLSTWTSASPGSYVDYGGIAMSTTSDMSINARVQEQITFCAGSVVTDASLVDACVDIDGTLVDLGVVTTTPSVTPVSEILTGNNRVGAFLVFTNAVNGVSVKYSSPTSLIASGYGGSCENTDSSNTDQCFNSSATAVPLSNEGFGMRVSNIYDQGLTTNLTAQGQYATADYAWNTTARAEIASSTGAPTEKVVDKEVGELIFSALARTTTPTGSYSTTANFTATATF